MVRAIILRPLFATYAIQLRYGSATGLSDGHGKGSSTSHLTPQQALAYSDRSEHNPANIYLHLQQDDVFPELLVNAFHRQSYRAAPLPFSGRQVRQRRGRFRL